MIKANNPDLKSWIKVNDESDFPIQNIPFGIYKTKESEPCAASIIGNTVIDLKILAENGFFNDISDKLPNVLSSEKLNDFIALGKEITNQVRNRISDLFEENSDKKSEIAESGALQAYSEVEMLLPVNIGDYTDFYSSIEHATNVGIMFRGPENALMPNWKHIPVGYHGRSSSIVVSGTNIKRPHGQMLPKGADKPVFGASKLMDFELETAFIIGKNTELGAQISTREANEYIFGMVLFNDLTARDIQKWEYVPLGPFLGKNFGSVISPWIVTFEALESFKVDSPKQEPEVFPYLKFEGKKNYDINLSVFIKPEGKSESLVCESNFKYMYWNMNQQLAHHTINGCNVRVGDMYASGTLSGKSEKAYGSMLELSWGGTKTISLNDGDERKFLADNDTVIIRGYAKNDELRIGFGEVRTKILPAQ